MRLGDRVLDVQHVGQRAEPMVSRAGLFTLGACVAGLGLCLVASGIADVAAVAAADEIRDAASTEHALGGDRSRGGAAGLGALLILLGVIPLAIAAGRPQPVPTDRYMIGEGPGVNLPVGLPDGLDRAGMPLLLALERQLVLGLVPGMTGQIHNGEQTIELAELVAQGRRSYLVPAGARCEAALGLLRFEIQTVEPELQVCARRPLDRLYWASNLGSLALIGGVLWLAEPPVPGALEVQEVALHRARALHYLSDETTPPPPKPAPKPELPPDPRNRSPKPAAPKPAAPAPAPAPPELAMIENGAAHPIVPKGTRRGMRNDHDAARYTLLADEGVVGALGTASANAQESALAFRDSAEDRKMWADVLAAPVIHRPLGGLELAETERGGGVHDGQKRPAKPSGKQVTIDTFAPAKGPTAEDRALARRVFNIRYETPTVRGDLSPRDVLDYVRKQAGVRNCFRDAVGTSDRVGTVIFRLEINGWGRVRSASLDYGVEALGDIGPCISKMAKTWKFPAPPDRQPVTVVLEAIFSARSH